MHPSTLIIAEAGVNHNGSIDLALKLVDEAAKAGANVVKFQSFKADKLVSKNAPRAEYQDNNTKDNETQHQMLKRLELSHGDHLRLIEHCKKRSIEFMSTPFDFDSLHMLAYNFDLPILKLGSGELTNAPILLEVAKTGKKLILSTGMSNITEVDEALGVLAFGYSLHANPSVENFRKAFHDQEAMDKLRDKVTILHCTTEYPTPYEDVNLRAMLSLQGRYGLKVGFSDHTMGIDMPIAAVALGATVIEKHFTLDRTMAGPDHVASLEPTELEAMVTGIRRVELGLGDGLKQAAKSEQKNINIARKSLVAAKDIKAGDPFTTENMAVKRPGSGKSPFEYWELLGAVAMRDYKADELL